MPCYYPLTAAQHIATGAVSITDKRGNPAYRSLKLPCSKCIGCKLEHARQNAVRIMHEASLYDHNQFITLTYNDEHLPENANLQHTDFQKFMKRLRKHLNGGHIRFYMCGEYGEDMGRPHYHACIFNLNFRDKLYFKKTGDNILYTSATLEKLWPLGYSTFGTVTFESAAYVARYCTKIITGDKARDHYSVINKSTGEIFHRTPEYARSSNGSGTGKGGIGKPWFDKFSTDVYPNDRVIVNGKPCKPPRYYDILYKRNDEKRFAHIQQKREKGALANQRDNTKTRRKVKEELAYAKIHQKPKGTL